MPDAFLLGYVGFMLGYPPLQLWTLLRCRGWWRAFALFCLIPAGPLYAWSLMDYLGVFGRASLGSLIVAFVGPWPILYLALVAVGFETTRRNRVVVARKKAEVAGVEGPA